MEEPKLTPSQNQFNLYLKEIMIVIGLVLSVLLSINAYFFKEFVDSLNQVKIQTAILIGQARVAETKFKRLQGFEERLIILEVKFQSHTDKQGRSESGK